MIFQNVINRITVYNIWNNVIFFWICLLGRGPSDSMSISIDGHYRHCMSWNINDMHCEMDVCIQFGWIAIILYLIKCRENPGKKSRDWVDIVHGFSGHCPWSQWTLSMDWVDSVHGLSGHCPWTQWTLSMDPCSNTPAGQCPLSPWTFYRRVGSGLVVSLRSEAFTPQVWLGSGQVVSLRSAAFTQQVWLAGLARNESVFGFISAHKAVPYLSFLLTFYSLISYSNF